MAEAMSPLPFSKPWLRLWEVSVVDWRKELAPSTQHSMILDWPSVCSSPFSLKTRGPFALREEHSCWELKPKSICNRA